MISVVVISAGARKALKKCPPQVIRKFMGWVGAVQATSLEEVRKLSGYHDEPLKGQWANHRSIRLSGSYRAIYSIRDDETLEFALVEQVNKHKY